MPRIIAIFAFMLALAMPTLAHAQELKESGKGTIGKKVVIGSFTVAFYHVKKDKMRTLDGGKKTMEVALSGLSKEQLQGVTNVAYNNFLETLGAKGITVRDRSALVAAFEAGQKGFKKGYQVDQAYEVKMYFGREKTEGKVLLFSPEALGNPVVNREQPLAGMFSGFKAMKMTPLFANFEGGAKAYAKDNGIAVINPIYFIDFADFDKYEGKYVRAVEAQSSLAMTAKESGVMQTSVQFWGANGKQGRVFFSKPLAVAGGFGGAQKKGGVPLGKLMGLSTKAKYAFSVDTKAWGEGIAELFTATSDALAEGLAAR